MISFSTAGLSKTLQTLADNRRDLFSASLQEYYTLDLIAQRDLEDRYSAVLEFRTTSSLPDISAAQFTADTSVAEGTNFFLRVMGALGIETTGQEDMIESSSTITASPKLASFITKQAAKTPLDQTFLLPKLSAEQESVTKHLLVEDPILLSDEDQIVFNRLKNTHRYVRELIQ